MFSHDHQYDYAFEKKYTIKWACMFPNKDTNIETLCLQINNPEKPLYYDKKIFLPVEDLPDLCPDLYEAIDADKRDLGLHGLPVFVQSHVDENLSLSSKYGKKKV